MFKVFVKYPSYSDEFRIAETTTADSEATVEPILSAQQIVKLQETVRRVPVARHVIDFALRLVRATRVGEGEAPEFMNEWVNWGAGPRGVQNLLVGGKARAALAGRYFVTTDDVRAVAHPVLRHRIITNFNAESEGITPDHVVDKLLETILDQESPGEAADDLDRAFVKQE